MVKSFPPFNRLSVVAPNTGISRQGNLLTSKLPLGTGCTARKQRIISDAMGRESLFANLMRDFRRGFANLTDEYAISVHAAIRTHLNAVSDTLDIVRNENVAQESEEDPEFRIRVQEVVASANATMQMTRRELDAFAART